MKIYIHNEQNDLLVTPSSIESLVKEVILFEGVMCDEVSVNFVTTEEICSLHDQFFNDPSPTDCISFPMDDEDELYRVLGEVFVCPETASKYVQESDGEIYEETSLYLVHGLLHLMGYDDIGETEPQMRAAEKRHMNNLKAKNLFLHK